MGYQRIVAVRGGWAGKGMDGRQLTCSPDVFTATGIGRPFLALVPFVGVSGRVTLESGCVVLSTLAGVTDTRSLPESRMRPG